MSLLIRQGVRFLLIGLLQLLIDWLAFSLCYWLGVALTPANVLGRVAGASCGFWLNGRYTFAEQGGLTDRRALARFILVWLILTALSSMLMGVVQRGLGNQAPYLAKPMVEGLMALLSFFLSRHFVYRARGDQQRP